MNIISIGLKLLQIDLLLMSEDYFNRPEITSNRFTVEFGIANICYPLNVSYYRPKTKFPCKFLWGDN